MSTIDTIRKHAEAQGLDAGDAHIAVVRCPMKVKRTMDEEGGRIIEVIASPNSLDLDREIVVPSGAIPKSHFFRNRTVFVDHEYTHEMGVGKMRGMPRPYPNEADQQGFTVSIRHRPKGESALSDDMYLLAMRGDIGTSIGFIDLEGGKPTEEEAERYAKEWTDPKYIVRSWNWLELSYTMMPSNADAQALGTAESQERRHAALDDLLTKGVIQRGTAAALGFRVPRRRVVVVVD